MFIFEISLSIIFALLSQGVKVIYRTKELEEKQAKRFVDFYFCGCIMHV
jgi:hypothetical protein